MSTEEANETTIEFPVLLDIVNSGEEKTGGDASKSNNNNNNNNNNNISASDNTNNTGTLSLQQQPAPTTDTTTNTSSGPFIGDDAGEKQPLNLFVAGLPKSMMDAEFRLFFSEFGEITSAKVMLDVNTGASRGYGFLLYSSEEAGLRAMKEMDGSRIGAHTLHISISQHDGSVVKSTTIYLRNIPVHVTETTLREKLSECGTIVQVSMKPDNTAPNEFALAAVEYRTIEQATKGLKLVHGKKVFQPTILPVLGKYAESTESREARQSKTASDGKGKQGGAASGGRPPATSVLGVGGNGTGGGAGSPGQSASSNMDPMSSSGRGGVSTSLGNSQSNPSLGAFMTPIPPQHQQQTPQQAMQQMAAASQSGGGASGNMFPAAGMSASGGGGMVPMMMVPAGPAMSPQQMYQQATGTAPPTAATPNNNNTSGSPGGSSLPSYPGTAGASGSANPMGMVPMMMVPVPMAAAGGQQMPVMMAAGGTTPLMVPPTTTASNHQSPAASASGSNTGAFAYGVPMTMGGGATYPATMGGSASGGAMPAMMAAQPMMAGGGGQQHQTPMMVPMMPMPAGPMMGFAPAAPVAPPPPPPPPKGGAGGAGGGANLPSRTTATGNADPTPALNTEGMFSFDTAGKDADEPDLSSFSTNNMKVF